MDVVRVPRHPGQDAADAPDDEPHLRPRLRGLAQPVDHRPVGDGVGLDADVALSAQGSLAVDPAAQLLPDAEGGHPQLAVFPLHVVDQHVAEEGRRVLPDGLVGGHQTQVGVHGVGLFVIVARADLGEIARLAPAAGGDETDLAVALKALHAIDDLAARLLQLFGPG